VQLAVGRVSVQAWSIVFHSWLSFVLLISACLIWIVPQKRELCLRCSPVVVIYAVCLISLQYIYGFSLNDQELPTTVNGYRLKEVGLVKYSYPVGPLAVQVCFILSRCFAPIRRYRCRFMAVSVSGDDFLISMKRC